VIPSFHTFDSLQVAEGSGYEDQGNIGAEFYDFGEGVNTGPIHHPKIGERYVDGPGI
jgi:hypothetical protein